MEHFVHCVETGDQAITSGVFGAQVVEVLELVDRTNLGMPQPKFAAPAEEG